jgi:hypothetical protein
MKKKAKKMAKKLLKKMIKKEQGKYTHSGFYEVPHNYAQLPGNNSNEKFYSVHLGKPPHFDGKDYPKWAYDMQMHLYGLHPYLWKIVVVGFTIPAEGEALTIEHEQDIHCNVQTTRVITRSLCAQEFNKVRNIQIAKVIWDTLKEAHEGTKHVGQGKMDLINGELELLFMKHGETVREMYDRLMVLVSDIRALGSKDWNDSKVTKKLLRAFAPKDKNLTAMIRRDPRPPRPRRKTLAMKGTDEETAFAIKKYKKFLKSKASRKGRDERKKKSQRKCYECGEYGHFIAECPKNKNKNEEERNTRRRARSTRTSAKGVRTWVNNGTQVMKMRNQRSKAWQPSPWYKSHPHHASSTTSPTMRTTLTFASWQGGARYKNLPPHLLQSPLPPHLVMT